jgi:hypothetical protein
VVAHWQRAACMGPWGRLVDSISSKCAARPGARPRAFRPRHMAAHSTVCRAPGQCVAPASAKAATSAQGCHARAMSNAKRFRAARESQRFSRNQLAVARRLAFFPPQPPTYVVKHHADGQREAYIQPTIPCAPHETKTTVGASLVLNLLSSGACCKPVTLSFGFADVLTVAYAVRAALHEPVLGREHVKPCRMPLKPCQ